MADATVRAAVVGLGYAGQLHLEFLRELEDVELVAVCDRDEARLAQVADEFGVPGRFRDHRELLASAPVDLLTVCTMPATHPAIVSDAFAAGAGVLCEKPLSRTLADGIAMADAARRSGRFAAVGYNLRHSSAAQAVRAFADDGRLGAPVCARGAMLETQVPWWGAHQIREVSGGGALASTAIHMLDLLMWLAGNPRPTTATASTARLFPRKRGAVLPNAERAERYDVEDVVFGHVRFENGFWLSIEGAWTWDAPGDECRFDLVGDRAQASATPLRFSSEDSGRLLDVTDGAQGDLEERDSIRREIASVVETLRDGRPPVATFEQALEVQAVVDALYRSAAAGGEVEVTNVRDRAASADERTEG